MNQSFCSRVSRSEPLLAKTAPSVIGNLELILCRTYRKSTYPFSSVNDLSRVLGPLLSASYVKIKETQNWVQRKASSQLDTGIGALSLGKPSPESQMSRPRTQLSQAQLTPSVPKSFVFGKSSLNSSGILKRSRLSQSFEEFTPPPSQDNSSSGEQMKMN